MPAVLILAGGRATRLGGIDKAFLRLGQKPLIARVLAKLRQQRPAPQNIAISANGDPTRFVPYALPILPDHPGHADIGPLAGILAGLIWAQSIGANSLVTLPVDTPFFPRSLLSRLTPAPAVATYQTRQHHLVAHWPVAALTALTSFAASPPPHRIRDALALLPTAQIAFPAATDPFLNINTPEDLAAAEARLNASGAF